MILRIVDLGSCRAIALTEESLEALGLQEGDSLYFKRTQDGFHAEKVNAAFIKQMEAADEALKVHRDTLEKLGSD